MTEADPSAADASAPRAADAPPLPPNPEVSPGSHVPASERTSQPVVAPVPPPRVTLSSLSGRPLPTLDPRPLTTADLEDVTGPAFLSSLAASRPTSAWTTLGVVAVGVAFVGGLVVGRGTAPAPAPVATAGALAPVGKPLAATSAASAPPVPAAAASLAEPSATQPADSAALVPVSPGDLVAASSGNKLPLAPFNLKAARMNVGIAANRAGKCRESTVPPGTAATVITFAPSGRVADAIVTTPTYAGTRTGRCIISKLKSALVPPYSGGPETLKKIVALK